MQSEILFPAKSRKQPTAVARVPISSNNRLAHRARMECAQLLREPYIAVASELDRQIRLNNDARIIGTFFVALTHYQICFYI